MCMWAAAQLQARGDKAARAGRHCVSGPMQFAALRVILMQRLTAARYNRCDLPMEAAVSLCTMITTC